jgi:hypothetical protein
MCNLDVPGAQQAAGFTNTPQAQSEDYHMKKHHLLIGILVLTLVSCAGTQAVVIKDGGAALYSGPDLMSGKLGFVLPKSARVQVIERRVIAGVPGDRAFCLVKLGPTEGWVEEQDIAALTGTEPAVEAAFITAGNNTAFIYLELVAGGSFMFHFQSMLDFKGPMTFQGTWTTDGSAYKLEFPRNDKRIVPANGFSGFFSGKENEAYSMPDNFTLILKKDAVSITIWNVVCRKI